MILLFSCDMDNMRGYGSSVTDDNVDDDGVDSHKVLLILSIEYGIKYESNR